MVRVFRSQADTRAVIQPESGSFWLSGRDLQPLTLPDTLNPLVVHVPTSMVEQRRDRAIAVAAILTSKLDDVLRQLLFIWPALGNLALGRTVLTQCAAGLALRDAEVLPYQVNALAPA